MLPHFHLADILTVAHYLGSLILSVAALMFVPLAVSLLMGEYAQSFNFIASIGAALIIGSLLKFFPSSGLDRRCALLFVGFSWVFAALICAIPLYFSGDFNSFTDALFDAVSSITTTGTSLADDLDSLSYSQIVWRACITLAGAEGIVIIAIFFGLSFNSAGDELVAVNARGVRNFSRLTLHGIMKDVIIICGFVLVIGIIIASAIGMYLGLGAKNSLIEGFALAANAFSTCSFVAHTSSLIYYHCPWLNFFLGALMLLGALNFALLSACMKGKRKLIFKDSERRAYVLWICVVVILVCICLARDGIYTALAGLFNQGMFMSISAVSTGGMQTIYPEQFGEILSDGALIMLMLAAVWGGCRASACGGIKIFRASEIIRWFWYSIMRQLVSRDSYLHINYEHYGTKRLTHAGAAASMTIAILYIFFIVLGSMAYIAAGNDAILSIFQSISFLCNTGVDVGLSSPNMPLALKIIAMLQMWAGRLEFIALFAAFAGLIISFRPVRSIRLFGHRVKSARRNNKRGNRKNNKRSARKKKKKKKTHTLAVIATVLLVSSIAINPAQALQNSQNIESNTQVSQNLDASQGGEQGVPTEQNNQEEQSNQEGQSVQVEQNNQEEQNNEGEQNNFTLPTQINYRETEIPDLLSASYRLDQKNIRFTGKAVGQPIYADEGHVWVNIKAQRRCIGVYMSNELAKQISYFTNYNNVGDTIVLEGVFNRACIDHSNELEVHATNLRIEYAGSSVSHPIQKGLIISACVFFILGMILVIVRSIVFHKKRHRKKGVFGMRSKEKEQKHHPVRGMLILLCSIVVFIAFLMGLSALVWFIF